MLRRSHSNYALRPSAPTSTAPPRPIFTCTSSQTALKAPSFPHSGRPGDDRNAIILSQDHRRTGITYRRIGFFRVEYLLNTCFILVGLHNIQISLSLRFCLTTFMYYYNARHPAGEINDAAAAAPKECTLPCPIIRKQFMTVGITRQGTKIYFQYGNICRERLLYARSEKHFIFFILYTYTPHYPARYTMRGGWLQQPSPELFFSKFNLKIFITLSTCCIKSTKKKNEILYNILSSKTILIVILNLYRNEKHFRLFLYFSTI